MSPRRLNVLPPFRCLLVLLVFVVWLSAAQSANTKADHAVITISDAWIRQPPPGAAVAGAYLRLHNLGTHAERLLKVETTAAERVEIHQMQTASGMMQMREVEGGLVLSAGEVTHLAPGGLHLMLITPKVLKAGEEVELILTFEHAPAQTVIFQVRSPVDAEHPPAHEGHHGHHQAM